MSKTIEESKPETQTKEQNFVKEFERIFCAEVNREGADKLLAYLKTTDFFTSPASSRFHSNYEGGLCEHSVRVYNRYVKMLENEYGEQYMADKKNRESTAIIALLHDICKVDCYKTEMRNVKVGNEWQKVPYYAFDDPLPYGHGEKSVYMISAYMRLTREEAFAINWHMGAFDSRYSSSYSNPLSKVFSQYPLTLLFHTADLLTSYLDERNN